MRWRFSSSDDLVIDSNRRIQQFESKCCGDFQAATIWLLTQICESGNLSQNAMEIFELRRSGDSVRAAKRHNCYESMAADATAPLGDSVRALERQNCYESMVAADWRESLLASAVQRKIFNFFIPWPWKSLSKCVSFCM